MDEVHADLGLDTEGRQSPSRSADETLDRFTSGELLVFTSRSRFLEIHGSRSGELARARGSICDQACIMRSHNLHNV